MEKRSLCVCETGWKHVCADLHPGLATATLPAVQEDQATGGLLSFVSVLGTLIVTVDNDACAQSRS